MGTYFTYNLKESKEKENTSVIIDIFTHDIVFTINIHSIVGLQKTYCRVILLKQGLLT